MPWMLVMLYLVLSRYWYRTYIQTYSATSPLKSTLGNGQNFFAKLLSKSNNPCGSSRIFALPLPLPQKKDRFHSFQLPIPASASSFRLQLPLTASAYSFRFQLPLPASASASTTLVETLYGISKSSSFDLKNVFFVWFEVLCGWRHK